jgi:hypothetical protein
VTWCDEALTETKDLNSAEGHAKARQIAKSLSIDDLLQAWRVVNVTRYVEWTDSIHFFHVYFGGLGQNEPARACDFILSSVANEPDDEQVALIGSGKLLGQLLFNHGVLATSRLKPAAQSSARMRWLLGSAYWLIQSAAGRDVQTALAPLVDRAAWAAWRERASVEIDLSSESVEKIAALWIEANRRSEIERARDDLHKVMFNLCFDLSRRDRKRGLALTLAVLARTDEKPLLSLLAAGLLENLVCSNDQTILQMVEAEAGRDASFRRLLSSVWLDRASPATASRVLQARGDAAPF